MDISKGSVVYSRAGRDKGGPFLVLSVENGFAFIADGDVRKVSKPKKKKLIHLNKTNTVLEADFEGIEDSRVRKLLAGYSKVGR